MGTQVVLISKPTRVYDLAKFVGSNDIGTPQVRAFMADMGVRPKSASANVDPMLAQAIVAGINRMLKRRFYESEDARYLRTRAGKPEEWWAGDCWYCEMEGVAVWPTIEGNRACSTCVVEP